MIINGEEIARAKEAALKEKIAVLKQRGIKPCLAVMVFSDDSAGQLYCRLKAEASQRLGIKFIKSETDLIESWNQDPQIHAIMIQRPSFRGAAFEREWQQLVGKINPAKDVDGLRENSLFVPATVRAVETILSKLVSDRKLVYIVVGRGMIGRQLAARYKVNELSSQVKDLESKIKEADILISATGKASFIKTVKPGAIVIDVGWPKGDVDFAGVKEIASAITPVPGGVGPVTVICLLENLVDSLYNQIITHTHQPL